MKVFISWSGEKSKAMALALHNWLPLVLQQVEPFHSKESIDPGRQWLTEISDHLATTKFGIVCVSQDNKNSPWLNFETGALSKSLGDSYVVPVAIDLEWTDVVGPLAHLQGVTCAKEDMLKIVKTINNVSERSIDSEVLTNTFDRWWSDLEEQIKTVKGMSASGRKKPQRSERELLEEILTLVRDGARQSSPTHYEPPPQSVEWARFLGASVARRGRRYWEITPPPNMSVEEYQQLVRMAENDPQVLVRKPDLSALADARLGNSAGALLDSLERQKRRPKPGLFE